MNDQDKRLKSYYQSISLPESKLNQLIEESKKAGPAASGAKRARMRISQFAQSLMRPVVRSSLAIVTLAIVALLMHNSGTVKERADSTFREVAMNHGTRLDLEYYGNTLASLDDSMQQLPFTLVLPGVVDKNVKLIGARYCSLVGNLAAHVKFEDQASGKPISLFVTGSTSELKSISDRQNSINGVSVEMWQEDGLFFALARQG